MKRFTSSLLFLVAVAFAITSYADVITYFNDFSVPKRGNHSQYRVDNAGNLSPFYSNFRYIKTGNCNIRFDEKNYIKLANGTGYGSMQMDASKLCSTATAFDLTAGDLVYECWYSCDWNGTGTGNFHQGIVINGYDNVRFLYHPGFENDSMKGAFRIEGDFGGIVNQSIGFVPPIGSDSKFTMMKLTIHRDEAAGNYVFKTEFGLANSGDRPGEYTYSHTFTSPIATVDAAGGIKSIGPFGNKENNANITNLRLEAPFSHEAFAEANNYEAARNYTIAGDKPVHWYKFNDPSTNTIKDYGSNPVNGTARNVDMSAISNLHHVGDFSGDFSKVDLTGTQNISGDWTAEFYLNPTNVTGRQALTSGSNGSLRWIMNSGVPGFTQWGVYDQVFKGPDGVSNFSYDMTDLLNDWIHVAFVRDDNSMLFYIDGELAGRYDGRTLDLPISNEIGSNGNGEAFAGIIDQIAFYNYAFTPEQVWAHANPSVPEPSTWALMILGAAGLLYWRKRK